MDVETSVNRAPDDRHGRREGSRLLRMDPRDKGPGSEKMMVAQIHRAGATGICGIAGKLKVARIPKEAAGICGIAGFEEAEGSTGPKEAAGICGNSAGDNRDLWDRGPGFAGICGNSAGFQGALGQQGSVG
jgi:hypothetical protein